MCALNSARVGTGDVYSDRSGFRWPALKVERGAAVAFSCVLPEAESKQKKSGFVFSCLGRSQQQHQPTEIPTKYFCGFGSVGICGHGALEYVTVLVCEVADGAGGVAGHGYTLQEFPELILHGHRDDPDTP
jgi:hypothetical protein